MARRTLLGGGGHHRGDGRNVLSAPAPATAHEGEAWHGLPEQHGKRQARLPTERHGRSVSALGARIRPRLVDGSRIALLRRRIASVDPD